MKFRHEYKFYLNYSEYMVLRQRLRSVLSVDSHTDGIGEYKIRSLYFDNLYDKALMEKINGVNNRGNRENGNWSRDNFERVEMPFNESKK